MAALRELTVYQGRQGTEVLQGIALGLGKDGGVSGQRGGPLTQLGARRKLWGGMGEVYFYKCVLNSYYVSGTFAETPKLHRSLARGEMVRVWARDERRLDRRHCLLKG